MSKEKLKVLFVSSECAPFIKSGGLGDVAGSLPKALIDNDIDCRVVIPKYAKIPGKLLENVQYVNSVQLKMGWRNTGAAIFKVENETTTYLVENHYYFDRDQLYGYDDDDERFGFFCRVVLDMLPVIDFKPDIVHCNDWPTGPICILLRDVYRTSLFYRKMKTMFTIHNLQYQGAFGVEALQYLELNAGYFSPENMEFYGKVNFMKTGLIATDMITTVSKTYAQEIQTPQYAYGLDGVLRRRSGDVHGIVNGIDYELFNPEKDKKIYETFTDYEGKKRNKAALQKELGLEVGDAPIVGMISRLADQKGFDLVAAVFEQIIGRSAQIVILGTGEPRYEHMFRHFAGLHPSQVSANMKFDAGLAQKIYAGSDFFLMPSLFEPCGLGQLIAMRYGTIPIVRNTGGLADTVEHYDPETGKGNGFVFNDYLSDALMWGVNTALDTYYTDKSGMDNLVKNAMSGDFSWTASAQEYIKYYEEIIKKW